MSQAVAPRGLEGIVATTSAICWIDGDAGVLSYRGIDIHELADRSTFEETTYLLWFGQLPTRTRRERPLARQQRPQELPPHRADPHDRRHLRSLPQRQARRRSRQE